MTFVLVFALAACAGSTTMTMGTGSPTGTGFNSSVPSRRYTHL